MGVYNTNMEAQQATTEAPTPTDDVSELDNVGPKRAATLRDNGFETIADVADMPHLASENLIGGYTGAGIKNQAKDIVAEFEADDGDDEAEGDTTTEPTTDADVIAQMDDDVKVSINRENKFVLRTTGPISPQMTNKARELGYIIHSMDANENGMCVSFKARQ